MSSLGDVQEAAEIEGWRTAGRRVAGRTFGLVEGSVTSGVWTEAIGFAEGTAPPMVVGVVK